MQKSCQPKERLSQQLFHILVMRLPEKLNCREAGEVLTYLHSLQPPWTWCCYEEKERQFDVETEEDTTRTETHKETVSKCDRSFGETECVRMSDGFSLSHQFQVDKTVQDPMNSLRDCNVPLRFEVFFLNRTGCHSRK